MENTTDALLALAELVHKLTKALEILDLHVEALEIRVRILEGNEP